MERFVSGTTATVENTFRTGNDFIYSTPGFDDFTAENRQSQMTTEMPITGAPPTNGSYLIIQSDRTHLAGENSPFTESYFRVSQSNNMNLDNATEMFNTTLSGLKRVEYGESWTPEVIQRVATLIFVMSLTLLGNLIIIIVLSCSKYRKLNSRVNIFIINLAIGDLTVCGFTMSSEILFEVFGGAWLLGAVACKLIVYVQIVTLASTTFILTAMSFDRYMAICKPLKFGTTRSRARKMIIIAWAMAFMFASPQLIIFRQEAYGIYPDGKIFYKCRSTGYTEWWQRKMYFTFLTSYILVIPSILISFCYINVVRVVWKQGKDVAAKGTQTSLRRTMGDKKAIPRAKIKTIKMTLSIIISFIGCWTPYFVVHLIHIWTHYQYKIPKPVYVFAETLALLNSALNPILYGCFNIKLKRGLLEVFCPGKINDKRTMYGRGYTTGMSECMSLTDDNNCVNTAKRFTRSCGDRNSSSSGSSHDTRNEIHRNRNNGSVLRYDRDSSRKVSPRATVDNNKMIKETNTNGFLYRIRFVDPKQEGRLTTALLDKEDRSREEIADYVTTI